MRVIRDAAETWELFAAEYRLIEPIVPTTHALDLAIESIIADITLNREVRGSLRSYGCHINATSNTGIGCSKHFLEFLRDLRSLMVEQRVLSISPLRAVEFLYNYDCFEDYGQYILRLIDDDEDTFSLVSCLKFEAKHDVCIRLHIPDIRSADDPDIT